MTTSPTTLDEDYAALRHGAGAVSLQRDVLAVSGADAVEFIQGQVSQDISALAVGESTDALVLTPQGKLDALVRIGRLGTEALCLDVEAGFGEAMATRLARFKLRVKVAIEPLAWHCVALRGPLVEMPVVATGSPGDAPSSPPSMSYAFSWNGVTGVDVLGEEPAVPSGVRPCTFEAWESVRIEAGIPAMGAELDERTIAAEADLLERAVSFTKGCYTGQELVARLDARGNKVARHLRGLVLGPSDADATPGALVGAAVVVDGRSVGAVTSAAHSPALGRTVGLAYVHRSVTVPSALTVAPAGLADSGDGGTAPMLDAEVRALPLV